MSSITTDHIAREAARLIEAGKAGSVGDAIRTAYESLRVPSEVRIDPPSHALVRRHARGMAMQAMGDAAYHESVRDVWRSAEEVMTVLERFDPVLAGRAARGQIDAGVTINIRIYTTEGLPELADRLVEYGYEEPSIETINTRWGRLNRLVFEDDGQPIVVTRCRPDMADRKNRNLYTGKRVTVVDLGELRSRL